MNYIKVLTAMALLPVLSYGYDIPKTKEEAEEFFRKTKGNGVKVEKSPYYEDEYKQSQEKGQQFINTFKSFGVGKENINLNLAQPLKSGKKMQTVDGKKRFDAKIDCSSSDEALKIYFIPVGNNEYRIIVKQDTDFDGQHDYTFDTNNLGIRMSGACTNGLVYCNPYNSFGNKDACSFYYWSTDSQGRISLIKDTSLGAVNTGTCQCSNSSCGYSTVLYEPIVGGIIASIQRVSTRVSLDAGKWDFSSMSYSVSGSSTEKCNTKNSTYGKVEDNLEEYYTKKMYPSSAASKVYSTYNPNSTVNQMQSPYTLAMKAQKPTINSEVIEMSGEYDCTIRNDLNFKNEKWNQISLAIGKVGDNYWRSACGLFEEKGTFEISDPKAVRNLKLKKAIFDDWIAIYINEHLVYVGPGRYTGGRGNKLEIVEGEVEYYKDGTTSLTGPCELGVSWKEDLNIDISDKVKVGTNTFLIKTIVAGAGEGYAYLEGEEGSEEVAIITDNSCKGYESSCKLINEEICNYDGTNCVQTYKNGKKTGRSMTENCKIISGKVKSYIFCANGSSIYYEGYYDKKTKGSLNLGSGQGWFRINRRYLCEKSVSKDYLERAKRIIGSSEPATDSNNPSMKYLDDTVSQTKSFTMKPVDSCPVAFCMVKIKQKESELFGDTSNRSQTSAGDVREYLESRNCHKSGSQWICPIESGEKVVDECSCEDASDKAGMQAIATLNVIEQAVNDMMCGE